MSLKPKPVESVPEETARFARSAHSKGHPYLTLRDRLGTIFEDEDFVDLFPTRGQPAELRFRRAFQDVIDARGWTDPDIVMAESQAALVAWPYSELFLPLVAR